MLLCRTGPLRCKPGKTSGWNLFAPRCAPLKASASAKISYALPGARGLPIFPGFARNCSADG